MSPPIKEGADASATSVVHDISELKEASVMFQSAVGSDVSLSFSHVHLYVDRVDNVSVYKEFEQKLNMLSRRISPCSESVDVESSQLAWESINPTRFGALKTGFFESENRDVVKQLLAGFGFRVTATRMREDDSSSSTSAKVNTRSVLVTSRDPRGVQFVVTALYDHISPVTVENGETNVDTDEFFHFDARHLHQFSEAHDQRQGVAVLAFEATAGSLETIYQRYRQMHPKLLPPKAIFQYEGGTKVLEVFAFYLGEKCQSEPDVGTKLRFIESSSSTNSSCILPGLQPIYAEFDDTSQPAYCDHWVSNVVSRTGFLDTLEDTLGFTPKVDFNAGVVAAGEAQIESTVTGNDPTFVSSDKESALKDQSQVYLPINNALSSVGHVGGFLREIGQGVQHIASRVADLISFVQRCNDYRKMTGEGFTFLNIPRSYYGVLTEKQLVHGIFPSTHPSDDTYKEDLNGSTIQGVSEPCASSILIALEKSGVISSEGAVDLDLDASAIDHALEEHLIMDPSSSDHVEEYRNKKQEVIDIILRSCYTNLYSLLGHHLSAESYVGIVKNQILVDVQGEDLLYQIFTCPILQRQSGEEAPFLEFIQRVCSECKDPNGCPAKMKPGCGGFGIRNFLTLFLSIEVNKAMLDVSRARSLLLVSSTTHDRDTKQQSRTRRELQVAKEMVQLLTNQLNESNPILTELSDAMTQEGVARATLLETTTTVMTSDYDTDHTRTAADAANMELWESHLKDAQDAKAMGHEKLMLCSSKYKNLMKQLREQHDDEAL